MSSPEEDLINSSVQSFLKGFHASVPLNHFSGHHDEAKIRTIAQKESDRVCMTFMRKLKTSNISLIRRPDLFNKLCSELDKLIAEFVAKNQSSKTESELFLQYRIDLVREDFETSLEAKLLMKPDMDLDSIEQFLETGKVWATGYFVHLWKHGNIGMFEEHKMKLEQDLKDLKKKMLAKQAHHLKVKACEDAKKSLAEMKEIVLDVCKQVKCDNVAFGQVSKQFLKVQIQGIYDDFTGKWSIFAEKCEKLYLELKDVFENAAKFLNDADEKMSVDEATKWAENLDLKFQAIFMEMEKELLRQSNELAEEPNNANSSPETSGYDLPQQQQNNENEMGVMEMEGLATTKTEPEASTAPEAYQSANCDNQGEIRSGVQKEAKEETSEIVINEMIPLISVSEAHQAVNNNGENEVETMEMEGLVTIETVPEENTVSEAYQSTDCYNHGEISSGGQREAKEEETSQIVMMEVIPLSTVSEAHHGLSNNEESIGIEKEASEEIIGIVIIEEIAESTMSGSHQEGMDSDHGESSVVQTEAQILQSPQVLEETSGSGTENNDVIPEARGKRSLQQDLDPEVAIETATQPIEPVSKRARRMAPKSSRKGNESNDLNIPDKHGLVPLFYAILEGRSVAVIEKMLNDGANVNFTASNMNVAHQVIWSLIRKQQNIPGALAVLDLLVGKGFNMINEKACTGFSPLLLAMHYPDLTCELLEWFYNNGADFNAVTDISGNSVLFQAIYKRQSPTIIRKIMELGGNPRYVSNWKWNALHMSARYAHESALEIFIDQFGVNGRTQHKFTTLHLLFQQVSLDYESCLKMLLKKGADFEAKSSEGHVPLVRWIKYGKGNYFKTLMKCSHVLPITNEIASDTLTAILEEMERLQKLLPFSGSGCHAQNGFAAFVKFLIEEKEAKLHLKNEGQWNRHNWGKLDKIILTEPFFDALKTTGRKSWKGKITQIKATTFGKLDFHKKRAGRCITFSIETVLLCLLACGGYGGFKAVCQSLKIFCESKGLKKKKSLVTPVNI